MAEIQIRLARRDEREALILIDRDTFWGIDDPCDVPLVTHKMLDSADYMPELHFAAEVDGILAGHILYSRSKIVAPDGSETAIVSFGPLSVLPQYRNIGVGKALLRRSLDEACAQGHSAVAILGEPDYYPSVGFLRGGDCGLTVMQGKTFDALMVYPLYEGALDGISGELIESEVFDDLPLAEVEALNATLPPREPPVMAAIEVLLPHLSPEAAEAIRKAEIPTLSEFRKLSGREALRMFNFSPSDRLKINEVMETHGFGKKTWN